MAEKLLCKECPRCKDIYPGKVDSNGDHFCICGMGGNKVYPEPRRVKRLTYPSAKANGIPNSMTVAFIHLIGFKVLHSLQRRRLYCFRKPYGTVYVNSSR